jgi:integrase
MDSRKYLTAEERESLETSMMSRLETDTRNATLFLLALHSGGRASEVLALEWNQINTLNGEIHINTLKGGKPRTVIVPKSVRSALELLRTLSPARPFEISYKRLNALWNQYRPAKKTFHALRHTFAIRAYERTKDLRFVMYALGHRNIQNTMIYAEYSYTSSEFKKMMRIR